MATPVPGVETPQEISDSAWADGSLITNPGTSAVLKQTAALNKGVYHVAIAGWASVDARFRLAIRNSGDTADVKSIDIPMPANNSIPLTLPTIISIEQGETLRVINVNSFTGTAQASILYAKVGGGA